MKGIIAYKSNYGTTKQYAQWLKEETGYPVVELKKLKEKDLHAADTIIIGGPILAHTLSVNKWIKKKWDILKNKNIVLYSTSGAAPQDRGLRKIFENSFDLEMRSKIQYFPQGGRMIFTELSSLDRFLMKLGQKIEKNPQIKEEMLKDKDFIDRKGIKPIIDYLM